MKTLIKLIPGLLFWAMIVSLMLFATHVHANDLYSDKTLEKEGYYYYPPTEENPKTHDIIFSTTISNRYDYRSVYRVLANAKADETVILHLGSFGGDMQAGFMIISAIQSSKAKVIGKAISHNYSMGALIMCSVDEIVMDQDLYLMFHDAKIYNVTGRLRDVMEKLRSIRNAAQNYMMETCVPKGILTQQQVLDVLNGTDWYVHKKALKHLGVVK